MQKIKNVFLVAMIFFSIFLSGSRAQDKRTREDDRIFLTTAIAHWYGLSRQQAILLLAIRDHEAGEPACKEFGIEGKEKVRDPLQRYCFYACYSARVIKLYCPNTKKETLKLFNHGFGKGKNKYLGYAEDIYWYKGVMRKMKKYEDVFY
jgi:hypothetical protein